jgi:signal transduction histidine kinase
VLVSDQVPDVLIGDPWRFQQIITNLVGNSMKVSFQIVGTFHVSSYWQVVAAFRERYNLLLLVCFTLYCHAYICCPQ